MNIEEIDLILSKIGGFINFMFIILGTFANIYNEFKVYLVLANKQYSFETN